MECLLFSQFLAAVVSLSGEECLALFDEPREVLMARYKSATEYALIEADFLNNRELNVVQTFALYIVARDVFYPKSRSNMSTEVQQDIIPLVAAFHDRMEHVYLAACYDNDPRTWSHRMIGRYFILRLELATPCVFIGSAANSCYPREQRLRIATEHLKIVALLDDSTRARRYWWSFQLKIPMHPIAIVLAEICSRSTGPTINQAWRIMADLESSSRRQVPSVFWRPLQKLLQKAQATRQQMEEELHRQQLMNLDFSRPPIMSEHPCAMSDAPLLTQSELQGAYDPRQKPQEIRGETTDIESIDPRAIEQSDSLYWEGMLNGNNARDLFTMQNMTPIDTTDADTQLLREFDLTTDWSQVPIELGLDDASMPTSMPLAMQSVL
ncbi:MAG: hypothetical protein M1828_003223 [Chrysothrix sp. TS-e1954]|nr:MAG: hypothetical protein M1828_003223 [Chrysothrix sp. TS-e1954]